MDTRLLCVTECLTAVASDRRGELMNPSLRLLQLFFAGTLVAACDPVGPASKSNPRADPGTTVAADQGKSLRVHADLVISPPEQGPRARFCLEALSRTVSLPSGGLPWSHRYSLLMVAVPETSSGSTVLRSSLPIIDTTSTPLRAIIPGEPLCGDVDLVTRFPDLRTTLRREGVWIMWAYGAFVDGLSAERYSGGLYLERSSR